NELEVWRLMTEAFQCAPRVKPGSDHNHMSRAQGVQQWNREAGILFGVMRLTLDLQCRRRNALAGQRDTHFLAISGAGDEDSRRRALLVQLQRARRTMNRFSTENDNHLPLNISVIDAKDLPRKKEANEWQQGGNDQQRK